MNGYSDRLLAAVRQLNGIDQDRSIEPDIEPDIGVTKPMTDRVQSEDLSHGNIYVPLPDHAEAFCAWISGCKLRIERGESVHEVAAEMILPVTFAARRI